MTTRSLRYYLPSYMTLIREFRNGLSLARAHHRYGSLAPAVFWNGQSLHNVGDRGGFVDTVVEIFGLCEYTTGGFYTPRDGDVVLDIGANIGLFSIWIARRAPRASVLAFEPFVENCEAMRRNLAGWQHQVKVWNVAIGAKHGRGSIIDGGARSLDHRLAARSDDSLNGPSVEIITLDEAIRLSGAERADFVKIDIEGGELDVFEASDASVLSKITRLAIEYHDNIRPGTLQRVQEILAPTHEVISISGGSYGILQAVLKSGVQGAARQRPEKAVQ